MRGDTPASCPPPQMAKDLTKALSAEDLAALLESIRGAKVAVTGDFCVDAYWQLDEGPEERSIETGRPVHRVLGQRYSLGGAGNVVANLVALGVGEVQAVGVHGGDPFGAVLVRLLKDLGVGTKGVLDLGPGWQTLVYAKPHRDREEQDRVDFGSREPLSGQAQDRLLGAVEEAARWADAVVVNQQVDACFASHGLVTGLNEVIASHPRTVFIVDARSPATAYEGAVMKLNAREAARCLGVGAAGSPGPEDVSQEDAVALAVEVTRRTHKAVFVTRGERGIVAADVEGVYVIPGVEVTGEVDPVGAGDTVVSAVAATLACGRGVGEAAFLANIAASLTVRKLRVTGTASAAEVTAALPATNFVYSPELAEIPDRGRYFPGTDIEVVVDRPVGAVPTVRPEHVVFDFDGTLSTLREGWEQVMEKVMVRAVLGEAFEAVGASDYARVSSAARELIDRTTGVNTGLQMQELANLVRWFGYVPEEDVLDGNAYKAIYNSQLMGMVRARLARVAAGQLEGADFRMKNVTELLGALRARSVQLYVASASDVNGVKAEAEALGLAEYFEGRIYGAVDDPTLEAKRVVIEQILADDRLDPQSLVVIGDGPAEMREARKRGAVAVGLCSDERRKFGANLAKRRRLIRGGATILVPDFTDVGSLLKVLGL